MKPGCTLKSPNDFNEDSIPIRGAFSYSRAHTDKKQLLKHHMFKLSGSPRTAESAWESSRIRYGADKCTGPHILPSHSGFGGFHDPN